MGRGTYLTVDMCRNIIYNVPTVGECAVKGDKTVMRPLAKLLWTLVS